MLCSNTSIHVIAQTRIFHRVIANRVFLTSYIIYSIIICKFQLAYSDTDPEWQHSFKMCFFIDFSIQMPYSFTVMRHQ